MNSERVIRFSASDGSVEDVSLRQVFLEVLLSRTSIMKFHHEVMPIMKFHHEIPSGGVERVCKKQKDPTGSTRNQLQTGSPRRGQIVVGHRTTPRVKGNPM